MGKALVSCQTTRKALSIPGAFLAVVRVSVALVAVIVGLAAIGIGGPRGRNIGAVFGRVAAHGMAAALGIGGRSKQGADGDQDDGFHACLVAVTAAPLVVPMAAVGVGSA